MRHCSTWSKYPSLPKSYLHCIAQGAVCGVGWGEVGWGVGSGGEGGWWRQGIKLVHAQPGTPKHASSKAWAGNRWWKGLLDVV